MHTAATTSGLAGISGPALFLALVLTVVLWCVPLIIAALYDLPRKGPIAVLSLALGWTGVGGWPHWPSSWLAPSVRGAATGRAMARATRRRGRAAN